MKKYKYVLPERVEHLFLDDSITGITYNESKYKKLVSKQLKEEGEISESEMTGILNEYSDLRREDFHEIVTKEDLFAKKLDELINVVDALSNEDYGDDVIGTLIAIESNYRPTMYFKKTDVICAINDNAQEGINDSIRTHLKNKLQCNEFNWTIGKLYNDDLQAVYKFYYYDENYRYNSSTGAGTLTGWLTAEEIEKRAKDNAIIMLNGNYKLSSSFFNRIKG